MIGQTKGTLTVIAIKGHRLTVRCECGFVRDAWLSRWNNYSGKGCQKCWIKKLGHSRATVRRTHPTEHNSWRAMKERCNNPNYWAYHRYGGRGIKFIPRWEDFSNFLQDMGPKPTPRHSLDRINSDADYSPENCRWALQAEQMSHTSRNRMITINGETRHMSEWCRTYNLKVQVVYKRLKRGWTIERTFGIK